MAGMLPGVECARRRRFHQGGWTDPHSVVGMTNINGRTRRSSFCLYTSSHETHLNYYSSSSSTTSSHHHLQRNLSNQQDEKLEGVVREAKERLDEKLRNQRKSSYSEPSIINKSNIKGVVKNNEEVLRSVRVGDLQKEVFELKNNNKSSSNNSSSSLSLLSSSKNKFMNWAKFGWKSSNQEECAVCLERFESGQTVVNLPCAHRFHSRCLVPWLETNANCPCCRLGLFLS